LLYYVAKQKTALLFYKLHLLTERCIGYSEQLYCLLINHDLFSDVIFAFGRIW